ncbi:hypothetical protein D0T49_13085 [Paludibacter sp. 221]|nr:hypothetical protein [Paludibacter sp. 221]
MNVGCVFHRATQSRSRSFAESYLLLLSSVFFFVCLCGIFTLLLAQIFICALLVEQYFTAFPKQDTDCKSAPAKAKQFRIAASSPLYG